MNYVPDRSGLPSASRRRNRAVLAGVALLLAATAAPAQPVVYPAQGQSMQKQAQDENECRGWAQQQTGFNPAQGPAYVGGGSSGGEVVGGAARGALLGIVGGAIGGNTGKGAAIGAGVGATAGLMRKGQSNRASQQAQAQANAQYNQQLAGYNRAFGACLQGRGYSVN